jgi:hypothetical protein
MAKKPTILEDDENQQEQAAFEQSTEEYVEEDDVAEEDEEKPSPEQVFLDADLEEEFDRLLQTLLQRSLINWTDVVEIKDLEEED